MLNDEWLQAQPSFTIQHSLFAIRHFRFMFRPTTTSAIEPAFGSASLRSFARTRPPTHAQDELQTPALRINCKPKKIGGAVGRTAPPRSRWSRVPTPGTVRRM